MADIWENATRGFNAGVVLGERGAERAAEREEREKWRAEQKERWDRQDARAQEAHDVQMEEATEKQKHRKIKQGIGQMMGLMNVGEEDAAIKVAQDLYKTAYPNGQDVLVFNREWDPKNKLFENQDKDVKYLVVTGRDGEKANPVPFKNANDIIKVFEPYLDYDKYSADMKELKKQRNAYNAAQESFQANDGKRYIKQMDDQGEVKTVPYDGVVRESKLQEKIRDAETALGGIRKDDKRKLAGLESDSEIALRNAQAAKARAEAAEKTGGVGKGGKQGLEMTSKQRDIFNKDLKILLSPFAQKGESVVNPETGELNETGTNALMNAAKLVDKHNKDPKSLTQEEGRYLKHAVKALDIYDKMAATIAGDYGAGDAGGKPTPEEIAAEAKRRGFVQDKNGKWVKPTRGGASAGFAPEEGKPSKGNPPLPGTTPTEGGFDPITGAETSEPVSLTLGGGPPMEGTSPAEDDDPLYGLSPRRILADYREQQKRAGR